MNLADQISYRSSARGRGCAWAVAGRLYVLLGLVSVVGAWSVRAAGVQCLCVCVCVAGGGEEEVHHSAAGTRRRGRSSCAYYQGHRASLLTTVS